MNAVIQRRFANVLRSSELNLLRSILAESHLAVGLPISRFETELGRTLTGRGLEVSSYDDSEDALMTMQSAGERFHRLECDPPHFSLYCKFFPADRPLAKEFKGNTLVIYDYQLRNMGDMTGAVARDFFECLFTAVELSEIECIMVDAYSGFHDFAFLMKLGFIEHKDGDWFYKFD